MDKVERDALRALEQRCLPAPWYAFYGGEPKELGTQKQLLAEFKELAKVDEEGFCPDALLAARARNKLIPLLNYIDFLEESISKHHQQRIERPLDGDRTDRALWRTVGIQIEGYEAETPK